MVGETYSRLLVVIIVVLIAVAIYKIRRPSTRNTWETSYDYIISKNMNANLYRL